MEYTKKPKADGGLGKIDIPLLSDMGRKIGDAYGVLNDAGIAYRGSFIIDDKQIVRHLSINDLPVGRNVDEYLRLVKVKIILFRHSNTLISTVKSVPLHGNQDKELCHLEILKNSINIGKKSMTRNDTSLSIQTEIYFIRCTILKF